MDTFIRLLDMLRDVPTWAVVAGALVVVALPLWWIVSKLFRGPKSEPAPVANDPPPMTRPPEPQGPENESEESPKAIAEQLSPSVELSGESRALAGFRKVMAGKGLSELELNTLVRDYAAQFNDARIRLAEIATADASDVEIIGSLSDVASALDNGRFMEALEGLDGLGDTAATKGRETRERAERELTAAALARLVAGDLAMASREPESAERHYRLAIEALPSGADGLLAECLNKHGAAAYRADKLEIAAMSFRRAVKLLERLKGLQDPDVATALNNLAMLYYARGDLNAAEPLYRRALEIDEAVTGKNSAPVATDLNNLALLLKEQKRLDEAEPLLKRALEIKEQRLEDGHPSLLTGIKNYAAILRLLKREDEANALDARAAAMAAGEASDQPVVPPSDTPQANQDAGDNASEPTPAATDERAAG